MTDRWCARLPAPRTLDAVLDAVAALDARARLAGAAGNGELVRGVTLHSAGVRPGDLFAGLPGARGHGADHAGEAAAAGAVCMLSDRASPLLPTIVVADPRGVLGALAAWLHGDPSGDLAVYGVTGTNGKTSTAHLLAAGLGACGRSPALASSLEVRVPGGHRAAVRTTGEAPAVQDMLAQARDSGATDAVLEVSSHGLALGRVDGTRFRAGVFTNLSPDHLDLHGDVEGYYAAKASLFTPQRCGVAVVNVDDPHGRRLARETRCPVVTFSPAGGPADWCARDVRATADGTRARLCGPGVDREVALQLLGAHQAENALAAVAALAATGADPAEALRGMAALPAVPGRLERVDAGQPYLAFVDFMHNVGGQHRLLPFLRTLTDGRLIVVLGVTGERDPSKRAPLGWTAAEQADTVVVTDESAYSDDPARLREQLAAGARACGQAEVLVEPDRAVAFEAAVAAARPGDVVVVAGRGADQAQVHGGQRTPFDDRTVLRAMIERALAPV